MPQSAWIRGCVQVQPAATVVDISLFKSARQFAAWLGLVPRQNSTAGKTRLGRITKAGNKEIRRLLVLGATAMVGRAEGWHSVIGGWLRSILERRPVRLVTVALANKMARIAWARLAKVPTSRLRLVGRPGEGVMTDRKSTRLNSSHMSISYAVFCLKKKNFNLINSHSPLQRPRRTS